MTDLVSWQSKTKYSAKVENSTLGSTSCINPVNFQVRTPNVKVTVRHNTKCGQCYNLEMARYSLNNSSIHPDTFCQRDKKPYIVNPCPRTFRPRTLLMKANKSQRRSTMQNTLHHHTPQYMLCYYFRHTKDFIGRNTRDRSPHASLDINTTSNNCPVSLSRVAHLVERQTPDSEVPGSNPSNTKLFFSSFVESMFNPKLFLRVIHKYNLNQSYQRRIMIWALLLVKYAYALVTLSLEI